jgi:hypothetical protein
MSMAMLWSSHDKGGSVIGNDGHGRLRHEEPKNMVVMDALQQEALTDLRHTSEMRRVHRLRKTRIVMFHLAAIRCRLAARNRHGANFA